MHSIAKLQIIMTKLQRHKRNCKYANSAYDAGRPCFSCAMSKDGKMGGFDSFDLRKECFTLGKPLEAFVSQQRTTASGNAVQEHEQPSQRSAVAIVGPSCSSKENETSECSWIREEDNREENSSSFRGLDLYSPQLTHPTKTRAKRPRTRRPAKNRLNTIGNQDTTEQSIGLEAPGPSFRGKDPLRDTLRTSPQTSHTIRDSNKESTSASGTKDNVRNLRALFEQM